MNNIIYKIILASKEILYRSKPSIKVEDTETTLKMINNYHLSICRFGDGEFSYIIGEKIGYQGPDERLKNKLIEILALGSNERCLVCIPFASYSLKPFNNRSKKFWFKYYALHRKDIDKLLNPGNIYYDSQVSRVYINRKKQTSEYFDLWKKIWRNKRVLIVEGEKTRFGVTNDLFSECKTVDRILCPAESAFSSYDEIYQAVKTNSGKYDLILISLGITATVLAWELSKDDIWCIDIGNMDNEYEWYKMGAKEKVLLNHKYVYEVVNGREVSEFNDPMYLQQIIKKIGVT